MSIPYIISVMSHDRIGIIADVTAAIKTLHGNLEDLSQTVLRGYFSMILLARFPDGTTEDNLRKASTPSDWRRSKSALSHSGKTFRLHRHQPTLIARTC